LKPRAIVFDLGKVLVDFDYGIAATRLAARSAKSAAEIRALIDQSPLLHRYEGGGMTTAEFFATVRETTGFAGTFEEFAAPFAEIFTEIPEMIALHDELQARGFPTFILSNTNDIAIAHVRRRFPFFNRVTGHVLSYEQSALKPHREIYEITERITGRRGAELLFIDDRAENVEAAAARGWRTICHVDPATTRLAVDQLLA
jgi:FMN phosphatase YigB (HAD superfamily)